MQPPSFGPYRRWMILSAALAVAAGLVPLALGRHVLAPDGQAAEASTDAPARGAGQRRRHAARDTGPDAGDGIAAAITRSAAADAPPARPAAGGPAFDYAAQLERAGASTCRSQVNALATSTMAGVETFNTISSWSQAGGDRHPVSLAIGQRYAPGSAVPFGVSEVVVAPNPQGGCDGVTIQVLPSPLSCAKLRGTMAARRGAEIGDLAGIALMQEAGVSTMLVPTGTETCVLVATRTAYAR